LIFGIAVLLMFTYGVKGEKINAPTAYDSKIDTFDIDKDFILGNLFPSHKPIEKEGRVWVGISNALPSPDSVCLIWSSWTFVEDLKDTIPYKVAFTFKNSDRPESFSVQLPANISDEPVHIRFLKDKFAVDAEYFSLICNEHYNYIIPLSYIYRSEDGYESKIFILRNNLIIPGCEPNTELDLFKLFLENQYLYLEWVDSAGEIIYIHILLRPFIDGAYKEEYLN